jgi:hypothetical protein
MDHLARPVAMLAELVEIYLAEKPMSSISPGSRAFVPPDAPSLHDVL